MSEARRGEASRRNDKWRQLKWTHTALGSLSAGQELEGKTFFSRVLRHVHVICGLLRPGHLFVFVLFLGTFLVRLLCNTFLTFCQSIVTAAVAFAGRAL